MEDSRNPFSKDDEAGQGDEGQGIHRMERTAPGSEHSVTQLASYVDTTYRSRGK